MSKLHAAATILAVLSNASSTPAIAANTDGQAYGSCLASRTTIADAGPFSWPTLIFFESNSALLTRRARTDLDAFKQRIITYHVRQLDIAAHTDSAERRHTLLDAQRAGAVRDYLVMPALPINAMFLRLLGNTQNRVQTASGVAEPRDRSVELRPFGADDPDTTHLEHRTLLCRRWLLDHCIGPGQNAPAAECKAGIDFLIRGDDVSRDLDWRTQFTR